jgi:hypothetical protein
MKRYVVCVGNARPGQFLALSIVAKSKKEATLRAGYEAKARGLDEDIHVLSIDRKD